MIQRSRHLSVKVLEIQRSNKNSLLNHILELLLVSGPPWFPESPFLYISGGGGGVEVAYLSLLCKKLKGIH